MLALATALLVPTAAGGATTGISDQSSAFFDSPLFAALQTRTVRLVVPWDAGVRGGPWDAWLARATRDEADVLIALEHPAGSRCPEAPCLLPDVTAYRESLDALLAKSPAIRAVTPWNEPNHRTQPTFRLPEAAATYYEVARNACARRCVAVAGDMLDDGALSGYLEAYRRSLRSTPAVWGLHNYYDATYFEHGGVDLMLARTTGELWLTETGGIVSFRAPGGGGTPYDEARAADSVRWIYDLLPARPRVKRVYFYQWAGTPENSFDSGLLGYDGAPRPAYSVVRSRVPARPGAPSGGGSDGLRPLARLGAVERGTAPSGGSAGAATAALRQRFGVRFARLFRLLLGRRLELRGACVAHDGPDRRCRGRIALRIQGKVVARVRIDVAVGATFVRHVALSRTAARSIARTRARRVEVQLCPSVSGTCTSRSSVPASRPLPRVLPVGR